MTLCELCALRQTDGHCSKGHKKPSKMRCVDFSPEIEQFCATRADHVKMDQIKQMAVFFGLAGKELKRVMAMGEAANKSGLMNL